MNQEGKAKARAETRKLVKDSIGRGDEYKWNQELYSRAGRRAESIPWADMGPNPNLVSWLEKRDKGGWKTGAGNRMRFGRRCRRTAKAGLLRNRI